MSDSLCHTYMPWGTVSRVRVLLTATDPDGNVVVDGGVVYDSSAYAFHEGTSPKRYNGGSKAPKALWSGLGEYDYQLRVEALEEGQHARVKVQFRVEIALSGADVVNEPAAPPRRTGKPINHVKYNIRGPTPLAPLPPPPPPKPKAATPKSSPAPSPKRAAKSPARSKTPKKTPASTKKPKKTPAKSPAPSPRRLRSPSKRIAKKKD